jgi:MoaA/NifB/PqqE/SkfB family radical SAM enzyme
MRLSEKSPMNLVISKVLADFGQVNLKAYGNALLGYLEGFFRVSSPRSYPRNLDIVLTKACNLRCKFCISYGSFKGQRWMNFSLYEQIARRLFPFVAKVFFCSGGEPMLYPRLREALKLAKHYRTMTSMVSNGTLLDRHIAQWLVQDQSLHDLRISFDGARKETVESIRRGANFESILANLEYLTALKKERGLIYPRLSFHYVVMKSNLEELPEIFKICAQRGLYQVQVTYLNVANDLDPQESLFHHRDLAAQVFAEARTRAREFGIQLDLPPLIGQDKGLRRCLWPWQFCQIDSDGSLRCCYRSWRQRLGFFSEGFETHWRGEHYQKLRRTLDSPSPYFPYCRYCPIRLGLNREVSHKQSLHAESYVIPGLERLQVPFNLRFEENYSSFVELKAVPGTDDLSLLT